MVRGPGIPAGLTSRHLVLNIDLAPTIVDMAGLTVEGGGRDLPLFDGLSLLPILTSQGNFGYSRQSFLVEYHGETNGNRPVPPACVNRVDNQVWLMADIFYFFYFFLFYRSFLSKFERDFEGPDLGITPECWPH